MYVFHRFSLAKVNLARISLARVRAFLFACPFEHAKENLRRAVDSLMD